VAGETAVDRAAMGTAAGHIDDALGQIRSMQTAMNSYHSELMGGWVGQAASAFTGAYTTFSADFAKVVRALDNMHEKLVGTRANYTATEEANTTSANKLSGLLNR
jgi:WXG100 family type VII secretion target